MTLADHPTERPPTPQVAARSNAGQVILGGVLVLVGLLWAAERADWVDLSATAVMALATVTIGVALMIRSFDGDHPGLIVFGFVTAALTALTAAAPFEGFQGSIGNRTVEVARVADLEADYELGAGSLVIDLRRLDWRQELDKVTVNVGIGELLVRVPPDVAVDVEARAGAGTVTILDEPSAEGILVDQTFKSADSNDEDRRLRIEANVLVGTVEVSDS